MAMLPSLFPFKLESLEFSEPPLGVTFSKLDPDLGEFSISLLGLVFLMASTTQFAELLLQWLNML
ncbi:hypothetical protein HMI55_007155 [Coelomomyces lativittatus]|nr:hypothetical protein HMI55_007155 [Coelomomyces lativittatus]